MKLTPISSKIIEIKQVARFILSNDKKSRVQEKKNRDWIKAELEMIEKSIRVSM